MTKRNLGLFVILSVGIGFFFLTLLGSCGGTGPSERTINYHHSFNIKNSEKEHFKTTVNILNNLCTKLELGFTFNHILKQYNTPSSKYMKNISKDEINILLGRDKKVFSGASYNKETQLISIAKNDWFNPSLLLHEIYHYTTKESGHAKIDFVGHCELTKNNGCMNLMSEFYYSPFNFLLTEIQHQKFRNTEIDTDCGSGHIYPKDLIRENIEERFSCCPTIDPTAYQNRISQWIDEIYETGYVRSTFDEIVEAIRILEEANYCLFMDNSSNIEFQDSSQIVRILGRLEENHLNLPDGTEPIIIHSAYDMPLNRFVDANYISYKIYLDQFMVAYKDEAEYLTDTNSQKENYLELRRQQIEFYLKENQRKLDSKRIFSAAIQ